jgi:hypothetical protein
MAELTVFLRAMRVFRREESRAIIDFDQSRRPPQPLRPIWFAALRGGGTPNTIKGIVSMKVHFVTFTALSVLLSASQARAQMTVDVAKITCRQYLFDRTFSPRAPMIANWLSGYFNGLKNNTVVDLGAMAKNKDKVEDYCRMNQDVTLIEAAKTALGLPK